ncbi:MAG: aspartate-semialdehyde dehydrogenase [Deltaproteobacteria bacterium]|nr:aspartate-semialdehyde dehydrogenase [Deltaproteobacteria bacterium]RLA89539.1 MAG: aspartate-semialdehyde dehydrogenase [Deltaproteobacteria bacterium]
MDKIPVGILGATGMVGQRFIQLLENHPWFEITEIAASERSAKRRYENVMVSRWKLETPIPEKIRKMVLKECQPNLDCKLVFSALDSSVAGPIEENFAKAGYIVSSNSKNHRMDDDVPLLIPEVNSEHLDSIVYQKKKNDSKGFIVTNPNCSTIGLVLGIAPLHKRYGIDRIIVTTMQALSGAGYPGVASMDIIDNVIPFISGEEEKVETEPLKILGDYKNGKFHFADIKISASCNRVNVKDGHLEAVSLSLIEKASIDDLVSTLKNFNPLNGLNLPFSPTKPIVVLDEKDRPQPRFDRERDKGMVCTIGRIRRCPILDYKFYILTHNTIRGAAGAAILNAEYLKIKGFLEN